VYCKVFFSCLLQQVWQDTDRSTVVLNRFAFVTVLGCVSLGESKIGFLIRDHTDSLRPSNTGNIFFQLVAQQCCVASWKALLPVLPPPWATCRATKLRVASCGNILRKVDLRSTFCNKFYFCCSYYYWCYNLPRNKFESNACDWPPVKRAGAANLNM